MAAIEEMLDDFFMSHMPASGTTGLREARLDRMMELLSILGHPEDGFRKIHVAGSKGKGSTSTMLSVLLEASGEKCGLYLSPHVYDVRERFTLSGRFFSDGLYASTLGELGEKISGLSFSPTTFELYTAFAYMLFRNAGCTYAVIETGLGGRLDATNTISSEFQVLTPIELEHQDLLGDTIARIAVEKSKIIKRNTRCYIAHMAREAEDVFLAEASATCSDAVLFDEQVSGFFHEEHALSSVTGFNAGGEAFLLRTALRGEAMAQNLALSVMIAKKEGFLTDEGIKALERLEMPGRFEIRRLGDKTVVFEVAHTKKSMENAVKTFKQVFPGRRTACVYSSVEGKDHASMMESIVSGFPTVVVTSTGGFKKSDPDKLFSLAGDLAGENRTLLLLEKDMDKALETAERHADIILVTGSFYLVGNFRKEVAC